MATNKMAAYKFDEQGRLVTMQMPNGAIATYSYDEMGNRTSVVEVPATDPADCCPPTVAALPKRQQGDFLHEAMIVLLSDGRLVGWGDSTTSVLSNGLTAGVSAAFPAQDVCFSPNTTMPPYDATIVDWAFVNANLYVIYSNGWVYSAGRNDYGQLGHGDTTARPYLTRIEYFVTNTITVEKVWAAGSYYGTYAGGCVYFQASTKTIYGCGNNVAGNLARANPNQTTNATTPVACVGIGTSPYVTDVKISAVGASFSAFMLMSDGSLLVAGYNGVGQLAQNNQTNVTGSFAVAKKTGPANMTNVAKVSANGGYDGTNAGAHTIVVDTSGNVWSTGSNGYGQLGIGNTTLKTVFTQALSLSSITEAKAVGGLVGYSYALDGTGALYTWGYNGVDNLFKNSTTTPQHTPAAAAYTPGAVAKVFYPRGDALGANSQLIVLTTSGLLAYAGNDNGQLGIANTVTPTAYDYIPTPRAFLDGTEEIDDLFVHGYGANQRWFIRSASGLLYACGYNLDSICTGGVSSNVMPNNFAWSKIAFAK